MSLRVSFDQEMELLTNDLIKMGGMTDEAIRNSITALLTQNKSLAREVMNGDEAVDEMEKVIESRCLRLLLRQQPVARDLRAISTALKMITDLERIGDQAENIAEISLKFNNLESSEMAKHIPTMGRLAILMVQKSIDAVVANDPKLAKQVVDDDDEVDVMFEVVKTELVKAIQQNPLSADHAIDLMMVAKYLERIADHAVNISDWVIFYSTGLHKHTKIL
ncbi:MAG: phosphate signaling complex protein PhoU [Oscillospiraceae bacterium]